MSRRQAEPPDPGPARGSEWQVGAGYAWSIDLLQSAGGRRYVPLTVSWGRDLMGTRAGRCCAAG